MPLSIPGLVVVAVVSMLSPNFAAQAAIVFLFAKRASRRAS
jgi:hypothetical protein